MGLTEKKVMFLTKTFQCAINRPANAQGGATGPTRSFYLCPMNSENIETIRKVEPINGNQAAMSNWDKFCILGIYIKFQPVRNSFDGANAATLISPVKCTYTMNNVQYAATAIYDNANFTNKQVFTFNSNEAFTIYVPAPTTMWTDSPVVHKSKTWWSLTDLGPFGQDIQDVNDAMDESSGEDDDEPNLGNPFNPTSLMHAGRIALQSTGQVYYNITINYKVALKG